jgi:hypothetical protein
LWLANVPVMTTLLFQAVRDTLGALLADPKYLDRIGFFIFPVLEVPVIKDERSG